MAREKNLTTETVKKRAPAKAKQAKATYSAFVGPEQRAALIAQAAYFRAERRGFVPGHETEDWLAAEIEVDTRLLRGESASRV
jgi:hypothetical protein